MRSILFIFILTARIITNAQEDSAFSKAFIIEDNETFREEMNDYFSDPERSSLPLFLADAFEEAPYYDLNFDFVVAARFESSEEGKTIKMKTSTERIAEYRVFGIAYFELEGKEFSLNVYKGIEADDDSFFLPFKDKTNGEGTYSAGRYLDIDGPEDGILKIDFNKSYNPSCAYSDRYSCPRVPVENHLAISVTAGAQYEKHEEGWDELDKQPDYAGNLGEDLMKHLKYPKKAYKKGIEGVVYVRLIVDTDGSPSNFEVLFGAHELLDEAALEAASQLETFIAGEKDGKKVRSHVILPITFRL